MDEEHVYSVSRREQGRLLVRLEMGATRDPVEHDHHPGPASSTDA